MAIDKTGLYNFAQGQTSGKNPPFTFIPAFPQQSTSTLRCLLSCQNFEIHSTSYNQFIISNNFISDAERHLHAKIPRFEVGMHFS